MERRTPSDIFPSIKPPKIITVWLVLAISGALSAAFSVYTHFLDIASDAVHRHEGRPIDYAHPDVPSRLCTREDLNALRNRIEILDNDIQQLKERRR